MTATLPSTQLRLVQPRDSQEWDGYVSAHPYGHLLQSWAWGEFKRDYGWQPVRLAVARGSEYVGAAQVLIRSISGLSLAYVPRGPVVDFEDQEATGALLNGIHELARKRHAVFLKVEPNYPVPSGPGSIAPSNL
ncbi:MAG: aminoacyltransferase, partial [Chloroflexota bacterium]|nr:aminoacyltransferase [Chloroflexota bacterium]